MTQTPLISLVAPFYNESAMVDFYYRRVVAVLEAIPGTSFELVCVNDGSRDNTFDLLRKLADKDARVRVVDLSRNFGKEAALTAGLDYAAGDVIIPIDADLQDPPELIPSMLEYWRQGYEVVLARRSDRSTDSYLKRTSATLFYRLHNRISDIDVPEDVGDFRLIDRSVVEALRKLPERRRFMKGLFAWVGFKTITIDYMRQERAAGTTKFSGWKLWNLAIEGITSFSTAPLRVWTYFGFVVATIGFTYALFTIFRTLFLGIDVPGYASLLTALLVIGGIQLVGIGMVGEYIGRIYMESKQRPIYVVRRLHGPDQNDGRRDITPRP